MRSVRSRIATWYRVGNKGMRETFARKHGEAMTNMLKAQGENPSVLITFFCGFFVLCRRALSCLFSDARETLTFIISARCFQRHRRFHVEPIKITNFFVLMELFLHSDDANVHLDKQKNTFSAAFEGDLPSRTLLPRILVLVYFL